MASTQRADDIGRLSEGREWRRVKSVVMSCRLSRTTGLTVVALGGVSGRYYAFAVTLLALPTV